MDINKAIEITCGCTRTRMAEMHWKASRYENYPKLWPEYRATYLRYKEMVDAIAVLEGLRVQGKLF